MEKLKENLVKMLFKHLNENLDPTTKAGLSSQQILDILRCTVDWVYREDAIMAKIRKAKAVSDKLKSKRGEVEEPLPEESAEPESFTSPEFMDELENL